MTEQTETDERVRKAFLWIVELLETAIIPYQLTGGLAARAYGSSRAIRNIDFNVPEDRLHELSRLSQGWIAFGPDLYKDERRELMLLRLGYQGQEIWLGGSQDAKIRDHVTGDWCVTPSNFERAQPIEIFGRFTPVIEKSLLIDYKWKLGREVDLFDITAMKVAAPR